jgi:tetratricopeptide (TPR) repeat protein
VDVDVERASRQARALNERLDQAYRAGQLERARALAQQVVDTYDSAVEPSRQRQLNYATYYLAHFCYLAGQTAAGLALTLKLYHRWEAEVEVERLALDAGYLLTLAQDLVGSREFDQALELSRLIGERLEGEGPPTLRRPRALALAAEVGMLGQLGRLEEAQDAAVKLAGEYGEDALAAYDEQLTRLDVPEPTVEQLALRALALYNKAGVLMNLGRIEEAKTLFTAIIEQYDSEDRANVPALAEQAREAIRALDD